MKRIISLFAGLWLAVASWGDTNIIDRLMSDLTLLGTPAAIVRQTEDNLLLETTDAGTIEVQIYPDSVLVVRTVCAPKCSSCVRVYNREWKLLREVSPTIVSAFPLAELHDGVLTWTDNDTEDEE